MTVSSSGKIPVRTRVLAKLFGDPSNHKYGYCFLPISFRILCKTP